MNDLPAKSEFLIYEAENGAIKLEVRFEGETVWLSQQLMADLFQTTQQNISLHLQNIYEEGELHADATHKEFLSVRREGQAMRRVPMHMRDWLNKLHGFLHINDREILTNAGKISHKLAQEIALAEYEKFNRERIRQTDATGGDFEKAIRQLPTAPKTKKGGKK